MAADKEPEWARELTRKVTESLSENLAVRTDVKALAEKVNSYIETLGKLHSSTEWLGKVIFGIVVVLVITFVLGGAWAKYDQSQMAAKIGEHTSKLESLAKEVATASTNASTASVAAQAAVAPLSAEVGNLRAVTESARKQLETLDAASAKIGAEIKSIEKRLSEIESLKGTVSSLENASTQAKDVIRDLGQIAKRMPRPGEEFSVWFELSRKNQVRDQNEPRARDSAFFFFEIRVESEGPITRENVTEIRVSMSAPKIDKAVGELPEAISCQGSIVKDNVLQLTVGVGPEGADYVAKHLAAGGVFPGQASIYRTRTDSQH